MLKDKNPSHLLRAVGGDRGRAGHAANKGGLKGIPSMPNLRPPIHSNNNNLDIYGNKNSNSNNNVPSYAQPTVNIQ